MHALKYKSLVIALVIVGIAGASLITARASAVPIKANVFVVATADVCGSGDSETKTAIDIGCKGKGNAIMDFLFAIIRILSQGVGIVIIGSIIYGGIQYAGSAGDPQKAAAAIARIRATLIALLMFIFAYPLLNYLIPAGFFK